MQEKPFLTIEQQINLLKSRGLTFLDEKQAAKNLLRYGYYEIINGYEDYFLIKSSNSEYFKNGTTFEDVFALFKLDLNLRTPVMSALEELELNLRQVMAHVIAGRISCNQDIYLDRRNYLIGKKREYRSRNAEAYPIDVLLGVLKKITHKKTEPFNHYREKHHNIPPWIIVKGLNFGNLIWWFRLLKHPLKAKVVSLMTNVPEEMVLKNPLYIEAFSSLLSLYLDYRNLSAHGGRIYNHVSQKHKLPFNPVLHGFLDVSEKDYRLGYGQSRLGVVAKSLYFMDNHDPAQGVHHYIKKFTGNYLRAHEEQKQFMLTAMELDEKYFA